MQSTGQASTQEASFTPIQGSAITYAIGHLLSTSSYAFRKANSTKPMGSGASSASRRPSDCDNRDFSGLLHVGGRALRDKTMFVEQQHIFQAATASLFCRPYVCKP